MFGNVVRPGMLLAAALVFAVPHASGQAAPPGGERPPTPVTVVTLAAGGVTLTSRLPGRVVASAVAQVRPQVDGIIVERLFEEGSRVELGQPLYRLDSASYQARVAAARAQVAVAEARLEASRKEANRAEELIGRGVVSEQRLETAQSTRDIDAAAVQVARAELQVAEIELDRATIRAKLTGVIGLSQTTQGSLVTSGQPEPLAVIRRLDPVFVDVTQSSAEILAWRRGRPQQRLADADTTVSLILADDSVYEVRGELKAAEPHVNESTGVVTLRMAFANPDGLLLPGMYVQVEMPQGHVAGAVLAPQQGVMRDRRGRPIAWVVNADNVVEQRQLTIAQARGSEWVVTDGLAGGDRLIIEGLQKVAPQAKVAPEERQAPAAAAAGPSAAAAAAAD